MAHRSEADKPFLIIELTFPEAVGLAKGTLMYQPDDPHCHEAMRAFNRITQGCIDAVMELADSALERLAQKEATDKPDTTEAET